MAAQAVGLADQTETEMMQAQTVADRALGKSARPILPGATLGVAAARRSAIVRVCNQVQTVARANTRRGPDRLGQPDLCVLSERDVTAALATV